MEVQNMHAAMPDATFFTQVEQSLQQVTCLVIAQRLGQQIALSFLNPSGILGHCYIKLILQKISVR